VVNASDINEMPENCLYVEGSILDRFLKGEFFLKKVNYNKILLAVNKPVSEYTYHAVNAARYTIGADIKIVELENELKMRGFYNVAGNADGEIEGWESLCDQVKKYDFDVLAIQSKIEIDPVTKLNYLEKGGVNPWGGVEAKISKLVSSHLDKPVAHSPYVDREIDKDEIEYFLKSSDPRMSAEAVSISFLHCIFKGLHKAPAIDYSKGISNKDIDFMISPIGCLGEPHYACIENNIPVIVVKENTTIFNKTMPDNFIIVDNYLEAAGYIMSCKAGVDPKSTRRPVTKPLKY
jgi:hypothetical protein